MRYVSGHYVWFNHWRTACSVWATWIALMAIVSGMTLLFNVKYVSSNVNDAYYCVGTITCCVTDSYSFSCLLTFG